MVDSYVVCRPQSGYSACVKRVDHARAPPHGALPKASENVSIPLLVNSLLQHAGDTI